MITRRAATAGLASALVGCSLKVQAQPAPSTAAALRDNSLVVDMEATRTPLRLRPDAAKDAEVWTFNGGLASVIRVKHGSECRVALKNETTVPLSLHFQGVRTPNHMDGVGGLTQEAVFPGGRFEYRFAPPDAGTFLIRPCVLGGSAQPLERGLSGLLIVEEPTPLAVDRDEAILIDDWRLNDDGSLASFEPDTMGRLGNWLSINGKAAPQRIEARPGTRIRLRLANACNARIMRLRFDRLKPYVIAIDSQPTDTFEPLRASLPFAPGTRYDVIVDVPNEAGATGTVTAMIGDGMPLVELVAAGEKMPGKAAVQPLTANKKLPDAIRLQNATRKDLIIKAGDNRAKLSWTINGLAGDANAPVLKVKRGSPVVLALNNQTPFVQPMHLHGHAFRLLHNLDDGWEPYFLDTFQVPENRTARIAFVADNPGRWLLASTIMERFDAGLWTWIEVN